MANSPVCLNAASLHSNFPAAPKSAELLVTNSSSDKFGEPLYAPLDSQIAVQLNLDDPPRPSLDLDVLEGRAK